MPFDFEEHVKLMYDLMALAYQANITRVITFMVSREVSNRTYPQVGVTDGHHAISHHQNRAEKMEKNVRIQTFNVNMFAEFLEKLKNTPDGDGSLLDHIAAPLRQQHEQQQRPRPLPAAEPRARRRGRDDEGRTPPAVPGSHADDEPAGDGARQGGRSRRRTLGDSTGTLTNM